MLVVDDEPGSVEMLVRALETAGHTGTGAGSADAAAAALAAGAYDLVLLDHILPGATGMQALGTLRAATKAPIYLMSGYSDDDTSRDALLLGAAGFLGKPFPVAELLAIIDALPGS